MWHLQNSPVIFIRFAYLITLYFNFSQPFELSKLVKPVVDKLDHSGLPMASSVVIQINSMPLQMWRPRFQVSTLNAILCHLYIVNCGYVTELNQIWQSKHLMRPCQLLIQLPSSS